MIKTVKTWMLAGAVLSSAMAAGHALGQGVELINFPTWFKPLAVSTDGNVVVGHRRSPTAPYLWTREGGFVQLRGPNGEAWNGKAHGCSADGSVVAGTVVIREFGSVQRPFRWTATTGIVQIMGFILGNAYGVSDDGSILVGDANGLGGFYQDAALVTHVLNTSESPASAVVKTVSHDGRFAVGSTRGDPNGFFVRWDLIAGTSEVIRLETPLGLPLRGFAMDCNADGSIVVGYSMSFELGDTPSGVIWTTNGLASFGQEYAVATATSADGVVIGGMTALLDGSSWISTLGIPPMPFEIYLQTYFNFTPPRNLGGLISISGDGRTILGAVDGSEGWLVRLPGSRQADFNRDRAVDFFDLADFVDCFEGRHLLPVSSADLNRDGFTDFFDFIQFVEDFER